ncbi:hypothetical protein [Paraherbaspirillum soli]|uniref:Porin n=1 Tax=Paraherbaspirillum soli TaxID=631222 RepID=A0ABW0MBD9_9BURK
MRAGLQAWCCGLLLAGAGQAQAQAAQDWVGGFVLADQERIGLRSTPLNVDNFARIAQTNTDLIGLLEGSYQGVSWRTRLAAQRTDIPEQRSHTSVTLQELNRVFRLGDQTTLSLGKRLYSLDPSYVIQPLGFFQKRTDLSDPVDALAQSEGVPMAVLSWTGAKASLAALYSKDVGNDADGFNRGVEQSVLKFGYEFDQLSVSALVRRANGEADGVGGTVSGALGETLSYYGAYYSARGTQRPILNSLLDASATTPQLGFFRSNDGRRYQRFTAGLIYTPQDLPKVQLEYSYDGRGLSASQYAGLLEQIQRNQTAPLPDIAIKARQAVLSQMLIAQGARQRYLSLTLSQTLADWDVSGGVYMSLEDRSKVWHALAEYKISSRLTWMLSAVHQDGRANSERALSPVANVLATRLRWLF